MEENGHDHNSTSLVPGSVLDIEIHFIVSFKHCNNSTRCGRYYVTNLQARKLKPGGEAAQDDL